MYTHLELRFLYSIHRVSGKSLAEKSKDNEESCCTYTPKAVRQNKLMYKLRRSKHREASVLQWNMLPFEVKSSLTVKDFKINLEHFKKTNMENVGRESNAYFWKVSETVLSKIEGKSYLDNKTRHNEYLSTNPFAARKLFINMRGYNSTMGC